MFKFIQKEQTGDVWTTVKDAAEAAGVSVPMMSKHLNGRMPTIHGEVYSIIGLGTTG